jgi:hypothetical protein
VFFLAIPRGGKRNRLLDVALNREQEAGSITEVDGNKITEMTKLLRDKLYGGYTELKEKTMNIPQRIQLIERLCSEMDDIKRSREEIARSFEAERRSREPERQRLRDTARNILKAGQPVEQVLQWTGVPQNGSGAGLPT